MDFPKIISFTLTYHCNLRCKMCGQWGQKGLFKSSPLKKDLPLEIWKKAVNEISHHPGSIITIRGGEPFLYKDIIPLLSFIKKKRIFISLDTNGTLLKKYAREIVKLRPDNINLSIDGTEKIHDRVRGMKGCYRMIKQGVNEIKKREEQGEKGSIINTICFVISPHSYKSLPQMPDVARELKITSIAIIPFYHFDKSTGQRYEKIMTKWGFKPESWKGFHRETSGVDPDEFITLYKAFKKNLKNIRLIPFMNFSEKEYRSWFRDSRKPVGSKRCMNPDRLIDIQPNGDANFCVDFPDYILGNIKNNSIKELFNNEKAKAFRRYLTKKSLPVCSRCGAKYMSQ